MFENFHIDQARKESDQTQEDDQNAKDDKAKIYDQGVKHTVESMGIGGFFKLFLDLDMIIRYQKPFVGQI